MVISDHEANRVGDGLGVGYRQKQFCPERGDQSRTWTKVGPFLFDQPLGSGGALHTPAIELISHLAMKSAADGVREAQFDRAKAETVFIPNTHCRQITAGHKPPKLNLLHAEQYPELAERQEAFINDFCALQFRRRCVDNSCDVCQDHWPVPV
jgi:hypothetical protein